MVKKIKKTAVLAVAAGLAVCILMFSNQLRQGVLLGLSLSAGSVIPSLFLFTAAALFIVKSGAADSLGRLLSPVTRLLFGLNGENATVFLISTVAGYPVGAKLIDSMYQCEKIRREEALKMLCFSVNAGPAFVLTVLGDVVLKSRSDGLRLLTIHLTVTCLFAAVVRLLPDRLFAKARQHKATPTLPQHEVLPKSDLFVISVSEAGHTMLSLTVFVVFFSAVGYAVSTLPFELATDLGSAFEVTAGLSSCTRKTLPKAAFLLGFGGLSVIFQVKAAASTLRPSFMLVFVSRFLHGLLSAVLCIIAEKLFPRVLETGSFNVPVSSASVHTSPVAALSLLLLCVVLLGFCDKTKARLSQK